MIRERPDEVTPAIGQVESFRDHPMTILAHAALLTGLLAARSVRGGFSGMLGTYLSIPSIVATVAAVIFLSLTIGWWTVGSFLGLSIIAGVLIVRDTMPWWVSTQPVWMILTVFLACAAWASRLL